MTTRPGSVDWSSAFAYYASLSPQLRSFRGVARRFGVSDTRVRQVAQRDSWNDRVSELDRRAARDVERRIVQERVKSDLRSLALINKAKSELERRLEAGHADVKVSDLWNLLRAERLIVGEPTDRIEVSEVRLILVAAFSTAARYVPEVRRDDFIRELGHATGGIVSLGELAELGPSVTVGELCEVE